MTDALRLVAIRDTALDVAECLRAVDDPAAGGTVVFTGAVRDTDGGRAVTLLEYSAHPRAEGELRRVAEQVAAAYPVRGVAAVHRVGTLAVGDLAVVVAVSCPHRGEAFEAARALIDTLKAEVPIWKRQVYAEGDESWVGTP